MAKIPNTTNGLVKEFERVLSTTSYPPYLILHSQHDGALDKTWQVIRCWYNSDKQQLLFEGNRQDAKAYLAEHWDNQPQSINRSQVTKAGWAGLGGLFSRIDHKGGSPYHCGCFQCNPLKSVSCDHDAQVAGYTRCVYAECQTTDGVYLIKPDADLDDVVKAWDTESLKFVRLLGWNWTFEDATLEDDT